MSEALEMTCNNTSELETLNFFKFNFKILIEKMLIEVSLIYDVVLISGVISSFQSEQGTLFPKEEIGAGFPWWGRGEESSCQCRMEKEMATHSSVLAWRIPGTEEPGGLLSMGSHRVGHD